MLHDIGDYNAETAPTIDEVRQKLEKVNAEWNAALENPR
jgi:hypothetical protein